MKWASPCASSKKDLEDGVTAGGVGVGGGLAGGAQAVPAVDQGQDIVHRVHLSLGQTNHNHLSIVHCNEQHQYSPPVL